MSTTVVIKKCIDCMFANYIARDDMYWCTRAMKQITTEEYVNENGFPPVPKWCPIKKDICDGK